MPSAMRVSVSNCRSVASGSEAGSHLCSAAIHLATAHLGEFADAEVFRPLRHVAAGAVLRLEADALVEAWLPVAFAPACRVWPLPPVLLVKLAALVVVVVHRRV